MRNWCNATCFILVGLFLAVTLWSAYGVFILDNVAIYAENGPLEILQAVLLTMSCIVFLVAVAFQKQPARLICLFCAVLCYSFVVRELDVERLNVHRYIKFIGSGVGRNTTLAVAFTAILVYAGFNFSCYKKAVIQFLKSRPGISLMVGGLLLLLGSVFEKNHSILYNAYFEEILELFGYVFVLLTAFAVNSRSFALTVAPTRGRH